MAERCRIICQGFCSAVMLNRSSETFIEEGFCGGTALYRTAHTLTLRCQNIQQHLVIVPVINVFNSDHSNTQTPF